MIAFAAAALAVALAADPQPAASEPSTPPGTSAVAEPTRSPQEPPAAPAAVEPAPPPRPLFAGSDGGWEVLARGGTFIPTRDKFKHFHAANALEVGLRRRLGSVLSVELASGVLTTSTDDPIATVGGHGPETWDLAELTVVPAHASVRATYRAGPAEVFAAVGGGPYWFQLYKSAEAPDAYYGYGATSTNFQLGAFAATGTGLRLTPSLSVSYELRYTYVEPRLFHTHERIDGLGLTAAAAYRF